MVIGKSEKVLVPVSISVHGEEKLLLAFGLCFLLESQAENFFIAIIVCGFQSIKKKIIIIKITNTQLWVCFYHSKWKYTIEYPDFNPFQIKNLGRAQL